MSLHYSDAVSDVCLALMNIHAERETNVGQHGQVAAQGGEMLGEKREYMGGMTDH